MAYATGRQRFLAEQGYAYKCLTHLAGFEEEGKRKAYGFSEEEEQRNLLATALADKLGGNEDIIVDEDDISLMPESAAAASSGGARRRIGSMAAASGADELVYSEFRRTTQAPRKPGKRHILFRKLDAARKAARKR